MPTNILLLIVTVVCPCVPLSVRAEYGRELPRGEDSPIHSALALPAALGVRHRTCSWWALLRLVSVVLLFSGVH